MTSGRCPLTDSEGIRLRRREPAELADAYRTYFHSPLPAHLVEKYFREPIQEFESPQSGLRWYAPPIVAGEDFYQHLATAFPWYHNDDSWDKRQALECLKDLDSPRFLDIGCAGGAFLELARNSGIDGTGIEINSIAAAEARAKGLPVFGPDRIPDDFRFPETLTMLQVIEHVSNPLQLVRSYASLSNCRRLIIGVPCHQGLLGHTSDPLVWPPHHVTCWSEKALGILAEKTGFRLGKTVCEPVTYADFEKIWRHEPAPGAGDARSRHEGGGPTLGRFRWCRAKLSKREWARCKHSILAVLER